MQKVKSVRVFKDLMEELEKVVGLLSLIGMRICSMTGYCTENTISSIIRYVRNYADTIHGYEETIDKLKTIRKNLEKIRTYISNIRDLMNILKNKVSDSSKTYRVNFESADEREYEATCIVQVKNGDLGVRCLFYDVLTVDGIEIPIFHSININSLHVLVSRLLVTMYEQLPYTMVYLFDSRTYSEGLNALEKMVRELYLLYSFLSALDYGKSVEWEVIDVIRKNNVAVASYLLLPFTLTRFDEAFEEVSLVDGRIRSLYDELMNRLVPKTDNSYFVSRLSGNGKIIVGSKEYLEGFIVIDVNTSGIIHTIYCIENEELKKCDTYTLEEIVNDPDKWFMYSIDDLVNMYRDIEEYCSKQEWCKDKAHVFGEALLNLVIQ